MRRTPVAHVIFPRPSLLRPLPEFALEAARRLGQARGLDVDLLVPVPINAARKLQSVARSLRGARPWPDALDETLATLEPKPTCVPYVPVPGRSIESATAAVCAALIRRQRAARPAVLQGSFLDESGFTAAMAGKAIGVPSIAVAHGSDVRMATDGLDHGRRRRARDTLHTASEVVAVSYQLAQGIAAFGRRAEIIRYTAAADRFPLAPRPPEGPPRVLFVGQISRAKGIDLLLQAFGVLGVEGATLELVGPRAEDLELDKEIDRFGLNGRVTVTGELAQADLPERYAASHLVVLPSRAEGLPCVLVEALLVGRPVIAADVGGVRELVTSDVGALIPPEDTSALTNAMRSVLSRTFDPERLRAHAMPMTWSESIPALEALTWRLVERRA